MKILVAISVVLSVFLTLGITLVIAQDEQLPLPKDESSQQLELPPQIAQRYTPQFVTYANENVIRLDHFILDEEGNLTRWCAIFIENKESGEEVHCLN